jgi:type II secretion system protein G
MRKSTSGFTIVELLIVIVIIAILATISLVAYNGVQQRARDSERQQDVAQLVKALELYYTDNGQYPAVGGSTTINASWSTTADASWQNLANLLKPYMGNVPTDPTSTPNGNVQGAGNYNYAYFSAGSYCNGAMTTHQAFLLVYRLEGSSQTNTLAGDCSTTPVGPYAGASNYRVVK